MSLIYTVSFPKRAVQSLPRLPKTIKMYPISLWLILPILAQSQAMALTPQQIADNQIQLQQQRDAARNQALIPNPTVTIDTKAVAPTNVSATVDPNAPCFTINQIALTALDHKASQDLHNFDFALLPVTQGNNSVLGKCLGINEITNVVSQVQNRIIERGYATTRVVIGNQNLQSGTLLLTIIPGYIDQIKADTRQSNVPVYVDATGLPANFTPALPLKSGDILNIRDLETGLENLKRVPTADADFSISPSSTSQAPGHSDVLIKYAQRRKARLGIGIDDSGSKATGKYQGNITLSLDNMANLNDLLYVSYGRDLGNQINDQVTGDKGSENYALGYVLPIDRWLLDANASHYTYNQTVAGANQDYQYRGESDNLTVGSHYLAHRDANSKTWLNAGGFVKSQNNYIDDTEVDVQRRKIAGWTAGLTDERKLGDASLRTELTYQRGTGALDAIDPPERLFNEGTARTGIYKLSSSLTRPFRLTVANKSQQWVYSGSLKGQYAMDALVPSERMAIGGRYSVRGFDGERTLAGDHGVLARQDVSLYLGNQPHAIYAGVDAGYVSMKNKDQNDLLLGHSLVGAAVGIKGQIAPLHASYDVFTGYPLKQPDGFGDKHWVSGFSLNFEF